MLHGHGLLSWEARMQIIPVIDVKHGVVVAARGGDRDGYLPIETPLAPGTSDPIAVARGYLSLYPFPALYMADLDGIAGRRPGLDTVARLASDIPGLDPWIDHGAGDANAVAAMLAVNPRATVVIGSETLGDARALAAIMAAHRDRIALSLDFKGNTFLGPDALLRDASLWPGRIIVMTLAAVGADAGPDLDRVSGIARLAGPGRRIFAAGGVRGLSDLRALAALGAAGVLVASALHAGKLKAGDLTEIAGL